MGTTAPENCGICSEKLSKGDFALCTCCSRGYHLDKCCIKKQSWLAMGVNKQSSWVCVSCRKNKKGSTSQNDDEEGTPSTNTHQVDSNLEDEYDVSSLGVQRSILAKINSLMEIKTQLNNIESSMQFLAGKYDTLLEEVVQLREDNKQLKEEVKLLKSKEVSAKETSDKITAEVAELDQYGRRLNLEIHGIKTEGDPREEKMEEVLKKVARDINVPYNQAEIHQTHRLQQRRDGKPPTIIVQFYSKSTRDLWLLNGRKARIEKVFFNENLCSHYRHLLREAKLRSSTHGFKYVWFKGGRVLVKRDDNSDVLVIKTIDDLKKIR